MISFTVHGKPQTAGSKQAFPFKRKNGQLGVRVTDANPNTKNWQQQVAHAAREAYDGPLLEGAISIIVWFVFVRPKGHFKKNGELRKSAPCHHVVRPDATKLLRAVEDALTGVLWRDDAQITMQIVGKLYGKTAHAQIGVMDKVEPPVDLDKLPLDLARKELGVWP